MKGAELLSRGLKSAGVKFCVFAGTEERFPLTRALAEQGIEVLSPVSGTAAVMIADGYARAARKPAVVISSGETVKLIPGTASAWADKTPLIVISISNQRSPHLHDFFIPITRSRIRAGAAEDILAALIRAFREAVSLRGGPVLLDMSGKALEEECRLAEDRLHTADAMLARAPVPVLSAGDPDLIHAALAVLSSARRPLILAGGGAVRSGACPGLNRLSQTMHIPIVTSMGGMGAAFPDNPLSIGPPSYLSGEAFHTAIRGADVVLAVGCVFSSLEGFGLPPLWSRSIRFIQVNLDPEHIGFNPPAEISIVGDAGLIVAAMNEHASEFSVPPKRRPWAGKLRRLMEEHRGRILEESRRPWAKIHPAALVTELNRFLTRDTYIILDGGNTSLWAGMVGFLPAPGRGFFLNGMATLGSGVPLAIGVKKAVDDAGVVLLSGDGSFLYNVQELETLRRNGLPILIVVFNDSSWNMIRAGQVSFMGHVYGTDLPDTDYAGVARSFGCFGARVTKKEEIAGAVEKALASGAPAVVDIVVDPDSLPDSLNSFAKVELEGARLSMMGLLRSIASGTMTLDRRLLNQARYILKNL